MFQLKIKCKCQIENISAKKLNANIKLKIFQLKKLNDDKHICQGVGKFYLNVRFCKVVIEKLTDCSRICLNIVINTCQQ